MSIKELVAVPLLTGGVVHIVIIDYSITLSLPILTMMVIIIVLFLIGCSLSTAVIVLTVTAAVGTAQRTAAVLPLGAKSESEDQ